MEENEEEKEPFVKPVASGPAECMYGESLMLFPDTKHRGKKYRPFYGVGKVYRVVKGDKCDLVYMVFGCFPDIKKRSVVVYDNHSRRQLLTLKRGQICQVFGLCRYYRTDIELNGKLIKGGGLKLGLYAHGFNGWYVPTMFDIKKMPTNEDLVPPTEKEEHYLETLDKVLDEFLNGEGEEDDEIR